MSASFTRLMVRVALLTALVACAASSYAQIPAASSARQIPTEVEQSEGRITQIIARAEDHFRKGKLNLEDSKREQARQEFDKAVDSILESGYDVRASQKLQTYYLELVERIYREEVPMQQPIVAPNTATMQLVAQNTQTQEQAKTPPTVGFRDQKFEPSPLDELSKLVLRPDETVFTPQDQEALEAASKNVNFGFTLNPLIQGYINYYQGRGRTTMESGLRRSGQFMRLARKIFAEEGVPLDVTWLGQVESSWKVKAVSWASASGLWQFVPSTGRRFNLRQNAYIDERNSIEQSTRASAKYLKWLADRYNGNWELAMAAYNTGEGNVDRAISRAGSNNFWMIYPYIAQETRNYVPNILAVILIAKNPEKYGFKGIKADAPWSYDVVRVPSATSLQLVADATDTSLDFIRSLNPELKRDITPRGDTYDVRVPAGRSKQFASLLQRIAPERRETARIISVAPGEDLQSVANRTGVNVAQLQAMNTGVDLKSTTKLVVPNSNVKLTKWVRETAKPADAGAPTPGVDTYRARKGDTIGRIATARNLDANDVARLNGIPVDAELKAGQVIKVPSNSAAPSRRR
ncbi:MAG TPA: transglycosylase SLT domain-containing protein [Pyrinomonadaceae bacterium]|jgi:membrane-bound lytic murein transglycosylase D|nr:transglycosylase SLT domain-containing protein [Pyrinomonadaceae bacterium]